MYKFCGNKGDIQYASLTQGRMDAPAQMCAS